MTSRINDKITALIPAAGIGKRFGDGKNKPFVNLVDRPLIVWAMEVLEAMPEIREIIPILKEPDMEYGVEIFEKYGISKIKRIAPGGKERQDSVFNGLRLIDKNSRVVLIHDGARPLIESHIIREALSRMNDCDGVVVGVPLKDTIKEAEGDIITKTLKRHKLWSIQTPQVFFYKPLYAAYENAANDSFHATDDSSLVERYGGRIKVIMGSYTNIKITTPEDLKIAELFIKERGEQT